MDGLSRWQAVLGVAGISGRRLIIAAAAAAFASSSWLAAPASAMVGIKQDPEPPWAAKTFIKLNGNWTPACTGTLIAEKTVITAAHCHTRKGGAGETSPTQVRIRGQWFSVSRILRLQSYVNRARQTGGIPAAWEANDVAFLSLDRSPLGYGASTAEIATAAEVNSMTGRGVSVFGYGPSEPNLGAMTTFIGKSVDGAWSLLPACPDAREFVAAARCFLQATWSLTRVRNRDGSTTTYGGITGGDSGGPWMAWIGGRWKLLGVVSGYLKYSGQPAGEVAHYATMASLPSVQSLLAYALRDSGSGSGGSSGGESTPVSGGGGSGGGAPPSVEVANNAGQMEVTFRNFPLGRTYFFCHYGSGYPTGGDVRNRGSVYLTSPNQKFLSGICSGSGNAWIGIQATNRLDYYSNQTNLAVPSVTATNSNGKMALQLHDFRTGTAYYFCHSGPSSSYPSGGVITGRGQIQITSSDQSIDAGICSGRGNAWIGFQAPDRHDYFSNQVDLNAPATPGASVTVSNNNGQMAVQFAGFPTGLTYYFCHSGNPSEYPHGGVITNRGPITLSSGNQSYSSGLCSGRGNAWIGIQATDGHDYYSNQINLEAAATPGASISIHGSNGQMFLDVSKFPQGRVYYFCHAGPASQFPTGGGIIGRSSFVVTAPDQTFGPLCSGSGNAWIGLQAPDGHDYYSNQIIL